MKKCAKRGRPRAESAAIGKNKSSIPGAKKKIDKSDTGMAIRASLVQKALMEKKEKLMAKARVSLGITTASPPKITELVGTNTSNEQGEPLARSSDGRGIKREAIVNALQQLGMQRKLVDDQRLELQAKSEEPPREFSGDLVVPDSNISSQSSVMKSRAGEDSFQLYRSCLLPMDQVALATSPPCTLEKLAAHDLMRAIAVTHQLTLQCTMSQRKQMELTEKVARLESEKQEIESEVRAKYVVRMAKLEHVVTELKDWSTKAEKALSKSNEEIKRLEQECQDSFDAGLAAGRLEFAESEEYQMAIRQARLLGAKDFKDSTTFELMLATKAAEYEVIGFMKCQSQISKLGGFKHGFDPELLDMCKDGNLESPPIDNDGSDGALGAEDPEFGALAEETGAEHQPSHVIQG